MVRRRADDLGGDASAARGAGRVLARARPSGAQDPRDHARHGRRVRPEGRAIAQDVCLMLAARKVPAAVKWIEDRRENLMAAGQARHEHGTATMAFAEDGTILAAQIEHVPDVGAYPTPWPVGPAAAAGLVFPGADRAPPAAWTTRWVFSNPAGRVAYRGPWQSETVAREMLPDIPARRIGLDPVELRRRNMLAADELPYTNPCGM